MTRSQAKYGRLTGQILLPERVLVQEPSPYVFDELREAVVVKHLHFEPFLLKFLRIRLFRRIDLDALKVLNQATYRPRPSSETGKAD